MEHTQAVNGTQSKKEKKKKILHELFIELVKLQKEVIASGLKLLVILEGRGMVLSALHRSPAGFRRICFV
jgi:polyphosphate kinase 2 (PPK2 family)